MTKDIVILSFFKLIKKKIGRKLKSTRVFEKRKYEINIINKKERNKLKENH